MRLVGIRSEFLLFIIIPASVSGRSLTPHSLIPPLRPGILFFWQKLIPPTNRLKCNRSIPCENCIRRGDAAGCAYAAPGPRRKAAPAGSSPDDMQNRIDRLEGLVLSLMTNGAAAPGPTAAVAAVASERSGSTSTSTAVEDGGDLGDGEMGKIKEEEDEDGEGGESDVDAVANSFGVLKVDAETEKTMYMGDSHWHLVLSDVSTPFSVIICALALWQGERVVLRFEWTGLMGNRSRKSAITSPTTNASSITSTRKSPQRAPRAGSPILYSKGWDPRPSRSYAQAYRLVPRSRSSFRGSSTHSTRSCRSCTTRRFTSDSRRFSRTRRARVWRGWDCSMRH